MQERHFSHAVGCRRSTLSPKPGSLAGSACVRGSDTGDYFKITVLNFDNRLNVFVHIDIDHHSFIRVTVIQLFTGSWID